MNFKKKWRQFPPILTAYVMITIVLTIAYLNEYVQGNRDLLYVIQFLVILYACMIITFIFRLVPSLKDNYESVASLSYAVFYTYVLFTSNTIMTFSYVFPMLFGIMASGNKHITKFFMNLCLVIVLIFIGLSALFGLIPANLYAEYEIAAGCIILSAITLHKSTTDINNKIDELIENSRIDNLTRLYDREFLSFLEQNKYFELNDISLILGDIRKFKNVNDTYGHAKGDMVLVNVARCLQSACKKYHEAYPIRIGGDEFIILCHSKDAIQILTKARKRIAEDEYLQNEIHTYVDFGIASGSTNYQELYEQADMSMYSEKRK